MGYDNASVRKRAKKYGYDLKNIITGTVLTMHNLNGPDHNSGKTMQIHRVFPQRHRKQGAA
jgi:hypothetical protein